MSLYFLLADKFRPLAVGSEPFRSLEMASEVKVGRARWNAFDRGESGAQRNFRGLERP